MPFSVPNNKDGNYRAPGMTSPAVATTKAVRRTAQMTSWENDGMYLVKEVNVAEYTILTMDHFISVVYSGVCILTLPSITSITSAKNWKAKKYIIDDSRGDSKNNNILVYRGSTNDLINGDNEDYLLIDIDYACVELTCLYNRLNWRMT